MIAFIRDNWLALALLVFLAWPLAIAAIVAFFHAADIGDRRSAPTHDHPSRDSDRRGGGNLHHTRSYDA